MIQNPVDHLGTLDYESNGEAKPMLNCATLPPVVHFPRPFSAIRPGREVQNEVKKPTQSFKVGIVTIREGLTPTTGREYYELRYTDPATGFEVRRRVSGLKREEVRKMANDLSDLAYHGKGYLKGLAKAPGIEEGMIEAITLANTRPETRQHRVMLAKWFAVWLAEQYPAVRTWDQLKPAMLQRYVVELERAGKAFDTVRLYTAPVKLAWRAMHDNYPELVRPLPRIKLKAQPQREIECLDAGELVALLDWLNAHSPDLWPMACLMGLAGLRTLEAAALRVQDVDLKHSLVTITKTEYHTPKTETSYRTIPVCGEVIDALRVALAEQKIRPATGELFVNERGNLWSKDALTQRWGRVLTHMAAKPEVIKRKGTGKRMTLNPHGLGLARLGEIPARKLRAAFATLAGRLGAQDRILKAYIGHSSGDILGGHYRRIGMDELQSVSCMMNSWRATLGGGDVRKDSGILADSEIIEA